MAFIRIKKVRGREYAYLVASKWDAEKRTSRQEVVKYLGSPGAIRLEDIPEEYMDERVRAFIFRWSSESEGARASLVERSRKALLEALLKGDKVEAAIVSEESIRALELEGFYVDVVTEAMHEIGRLWKKGDISISVEHLASNIMSEIVAVENSRAPRSRAWRGTAVICTPQSEEHNLASKVLEGLLRAKGCTVWNISTSAPTESIIGFVAAKDPNRVLISLTIPEFLPAAVRLVKAINEEAPRTKVIVGGQGVKEGMEGRFPPGTVVATGGIAQALEAL